MSVPQAASVMVRGQAVRGAATTKANAVGSVTEQLAIEPCDNNMVFELRDFVSVVRGEKLDTLWGSGMDARGAESSFTDVTLDALAVCDEIRHQAGVHFPADFRVE